MEVENDVVSVGGAGPWRETRAQDTRGGCKPAVGMCIVGMCEMVVSCVHEGGRCRQCFDLALPSNVWGSGMADNSAASTPRSGYRDGSVRASRNRGINWRDGLHPLLLWYGLQPQEGVRVRWTRADARRYGAKTTTTTSRHQACRKSLHTSFRQTNRRRVKLSVRETGNYVIIKPAVAFGL